MLSLFRGNTRVVAVFEGSTPSPVEIKTPITPEVFQDRHLDGKKCLGFYLMRPQDDTVLCACLDFDNHDGLNDAALSDARTATIYLSDMGCHPLLEISQSGVGAHVWLFFESPVAAKSVRGSLRRVLHDIQSVAEIYPKQDSVQHLSERLGNFVRYPLWSSSHFIDASTGEALEPSEALCVRFTSPDDLPEEYNPNTVTRIGHGYETEGLPSRVLEVLEEEPTSILARRWGCDIGGMREGSRSDIAMAIAAELVRYLIPTPEIEAALRYWCQKIGYEQTDRWISLTVANAYAFGKQVTRARGYGETFTSIVHTQIDKIAQGDEIIVPFGIEEVDDAIGGIAFGEYAIFCARPSHGKSALSLEWLDNCASRGYPGLYISLEMSPGFTASRMLPRMGVPTESIPDTSISEVHSIADEYFRHRAPIYFRDVQDMGGSSLDVIEQTIQHYVEHRGVRTVVVDYLELIARKGSDYETQTEANRMFARVSKKFNIIPVGLIQLKRSSDDGKEPRRPSTGDLKFAGEQDADVIIAGRWLWKENPLDEWKNRYIMYMLKNRNRAINSIDVEVIFESNQQRFYSRNMREDS